MGYWRVRIATNRIHEKTLEVEASCNADAYEKACAAVKEDPGDDWDDREWSGNYYVIHGPIRLTDEEERAVKRRDLVEWAAEEIYRSMSDTGCPAHMAGELAKEIIDKVLEGMGSK